MKKCITLFFLFTAITGIAGICFAEESRKSEDTVESRMDVSFYASTRGEVQVNFLLMVVWARTMLRNEEEISNVVSV